MSAGVNHTRVGNCPLARGEFPKAAASGYPKKRPKLEYADILFIHSPTNHYDAAISEAYPVLAEMRSSGMVKAIGVGMTDWQSLLQFVLAHPAVTSVIPGSSYPEHIHENIAMIQYDIPIDLWNDLRHEGLIDEGAPVPRWRDDSSVSGESLPVNHI